MKINKGGKKRKKKETRRNQDKNKQDKQVNEKDESLGTLKMLNKDYSRNM